MSEQQQQPTQALTTKNLFAKDEVRAKFQEMLGKRAPQFITSVLQIVASNALLANADPHSVYHSAAVAATLDLPLNNNLGFAYIVPYNQRQKDGTYRQVAQFQMGYKGFIQLAQRSGMYRTLSATPIYEGQLVEENPLTGFVFDFTKKKSDTIIGYASYFELLNGFQKTLYSTVDQLKAHGMKYSQTYKKGFGLWKDDFDAMALKTVIKANLSKWGPLSVEMQKAVVTDQSIVNNEDATDITYVDNEPDQIDHESERVVLMIHDAKTVDELKSLEPHVKDAQLDLYTVKMDELKAKK